MKETQKMLFYRANFLKLWLKISLIILNLLGGIDIENLSFLMVLINILNIIKKRKQMEESQKRLKISQVKIFINQVKDIEPVQLMTKLVKL